MFALPAVMCMILLKEIRMEVLHPVHHLKTFRMIGFARCAEWVRTCLKRNNDLDWMMTHIGVMA